MKCIVDLVTRGYLLDGYFFFSILVDSAPDDSVGTFAKPLHDGVLVKDVRLEVFDVGHFPRIYSNYRPLLIAEFCCAQKQTSVDLELWRA